MQQRDSFHKKSKKLIKRTLHSLKHFLLFDGYQKLHRSSSFRALACASCRDLVGKAPQTEESYPGYGGKWALAEESYPGFSRRWAQMEGFKEDGEEDEPSGSNTTEKKVDVPKEEEGAMKVEKVKVGNSRPPPSLRGGEAEGFVLARKMKELEMMEVGDMEHALDIEEALHYYSRITSPVYAGIVDKFFMDMYFDFSPSLAPQAQRPVARNSRQRRAVGRTVR